MDTISPALGFAARITIALTINNLSEARIQIQKAYNNSISHEFLYESILQMYLFAGFPATLEGLSLLNEIYGEQHFTNSESYDIEKFFKRGQETCKAIYGSVFDKMIMRVQRFSPDLASWMIIEGYGKTLSRNGISLKERELLNIGIIAIGKWKHQLYSHIRGALLVGASKQEIYLIINELETMSLHDSYRLAHELLQELSS